MIYFLALLCIICVEAFVLFHCRLSAQTQKKVFLGLAFVQLSLFIGLRGDSTSIDTLTYWNFFKSFEAGAVVQQAYLIDFEIGFEIRQNRMQL